MLDRAAVGLASREASENLKAAVGAISDPQFPVEEPDAFSDADKAAPPGSGAQRAIAARAFDDDLGGNPAGLEGDVHVGLRVPTVGLVESVLDHPVDGNTDAPVDRPPTTRTAQRRSKTAGRGPFSEPPELVEPH
jgi:hypothetical protein